MREFSRPLSVAVPTAGSITDDIVRNAEDHPDRVAFCYRPGAPGQPRAEVTAAEFLVDVRRVAKGLVAAGVAPGDRVLLLSRTRYEWTVVDYAIWYCGAVGVPVYETSSAEQLAWVVADAGARAAVVETAEHTDRLRQGADGQLDHLWTLDGNPGAISVLADLGATVPDAVLEARRATVSPVDVATIVYTSGTSGPPKGCVLTHGNFMFELAVTLDELRVVFDVEDAATLLVLPMAHVFARIIQVGAVRAGVRLSHTADVRRLLDDLDEFQPTFVLGVPRLFEKIFNTASQRAVAEGRGRLFDRATEAAIGYSQALDSGGPGPLLRARHAVYDRLVYAQLRAALGGRCRYAVSGGAPLGERLGHFFRGIGVPILEGYGLTETTGAATVNVADPLRIGSVGRPLPGTSVRVAPDGELLVRGRHVMHGYWADDVATRETITPDGWLHTGDLGEIDVEGFVRVTGRKKEILVTAGGKNVAPGLLEDRLRAHYLVSQCLVVGDGRAYVAALVTLDPEAFATWAERHGKRGPLRALTHDPDLLAELQAAVDETNRTVSQAEWIRRFEVLPEEWTEERGELTPSLKLRRNVVLRHYREQVESLYV